MSKLCFGSYTTILRKYINGTNEEVVNDLLSGIKDNTSIDKGNVSRYINSKENLPKDLIELSQTNKVATNIEQYFSDYIIPNLKTKLQESMIQHLQLLISGDTSIPNQTKEKLIYYKNGNLADFLSQIFLYALLQDNICENPLENLGVLPIQKNPEFNHTINSSGFENVFIEVPHDKDLGLLNNNHIKTFHFNIENNKFSHVGLQKYLLKNIGRYIYSRLQIDEFTTNNEQEIIAHEAIKKLKESGFSDKQLGDELGNIIIYLFLEKILQAPKLYTNIECQEVGLNKAGVHLLKLSGQDKDFQMVFSKSNIANDLKESIDNAFENLSLLNKSIPNHYRFLETSILTQNFDNATSEHLKNIIIPQKRGHETTVNNAFGVLIGYSININRNVDNKTFVKNLKEQMIKDLQEQLPYIVTKINDLEMQNSSFYIYLMPFDNANNDKSTIMRNIVGGSV